jgi:putative membrane protein
MHWDNGHMDSGWGVAMMMSMLLFWVLIAVAVVWFVRTTRAPHPPAAPQLTTGPPPAGAEQILAERLARGEIELEDYQTRLTALRTPT